MRIGRKNIVQTRKDEEYVRRYILSTPMRVLRYTSAYIAVEFIFNRHSV